MCLAGSQLTTWKDILSVDRTPRLKDYTLSACLSITSRYRVWGLRLNPAPLGSLHDDEVGLAGLRKLPIM